MGISRKHALRRMNGLARQVDEHMIKIADDPKSRVAVHWRAEVRGWILQMHELLPRIGGKTAAEWTIRIESWGGGLGD